jgi:murein DD-endopeptidase MepM/ murein hydrolase activator NlpD
MADGFYTVIIVPHAKARFRKLRIPLRLLQWGTVIGAFLAFVAIVGLVHMTRMSWEVYHLRRLRTENTALKAKARDYEQKYDAHQARLRQLEGTVKKLGVMAGLEQVLPDGDVGGVGGVSGADTLSPSLERETLRVMDESLTELEARSRELDTFFTDQKVLLASTPSIWPVRGYLSSVFGRRTDPFTGQSDFHPAIDISTPLGTKIVAPADGVVVECSKKGGYGKAMIIDHGFGIVTRYGHLDGYNVRPGQRVRRGDVIGFVGNTGRSTAPHLHYEVWVHDQAQNPIHFILDEFRSFG